MEISEGVKKLQALIGNTDYEAVHAEVDNIMGEFVPKEISDARLKVIEQAKWWPYA